jgi:hypothetical protein
MLTRLWLVGRTVTGDCLKRRPQRNGAAAEVGGARDAAKASAATLDGAIDAARAWLEHAQDVTPDGGVAAGFHLKDGWLSSYPETTGYIAETFFDLADSENDPLAEARAWRMIDWLLTLQEPEGGFPGQFGTRSRGPIVFNTGQILHGLVRAVARDPARRDIQDAIARASRWLVAACEVDGCWRRHTHHGVPHSYNTRTAWALLRAAALTGDDLARETAARNVAWALDQQASDGWLAHAAFTPDAPPFLHTIAYALRGLLECGVLLNSEAAITGARLGAAALRVDLAAHNALAGAYASGWQADRAFRCLTGEAQTAVLWARLAETTGDARYLNACTQLTQAVAAVQVQTGPACVRGAIAGSDPIWGRYSRFEYPNWAAKFFIDAGLASRRFAQQAQADKELACASAS